jgi:hypothetical protein
MERNSKFIFSPFLQNGSGVHPASYSVGAEVKNKHSYNACVSYWFMAYTRTTLPYTEHNGGVANIVAFIHNIPGQNTKPTPPLLIKIL